MEMTGGITLPEPPKPLGRYVPAVRSGNLLFVSGMLPLINGQPQHIGRIGRDLTVDQGRAAARTATLNGISAAAALAGGPARLRRVVRLAVYQRTTEDFEQHAAVADGASELIHDLFKSEPGHARLVFGVSTLPGGMPVELELIFEVV